MDRHTGEVDISGERISSSPLPSQLCQRREHLNCLLSKHVALIDEIQRSAKDLVFGQDDYIATQIDQLRRAATEVHRAAVPEQGCASGAPSSAWDPQGSRSPHSSNEDQLCHHIQRNGSNDLAKPQPTPTGPTRVMPRSGSYAHLHDHSTQLNSSMSCDELLSMLDSVTNPGAVFSTEPARTGSPSSHPRKKRSAGELDTVPEPPLPPPALRSLYDHSVQLQQLQQQQTQLQQQQQQLQQQQQMQQQQVTQGPQVQLLTTGGAIATGQPMPKLLAPQSQHVAPSPFSTAPQRPMQPMPKQQAPGSVPQPLGRTTRYAQYPPQGTMQFSGPLPSYPPTMGQMAPQGPQNLGQPMPQNLVRQPNPAYMGAPMPWGPSRMMPMPMMQQPGAQQGQYPGVPPMMAPQRNLMPYGGPNPYARPGAVAQAPASVPTPAPVAPLAAPSKLPLPVPAGLPQVRVPKSELAQKQNNAGKGPASAATQAANGNKSKTPAQLADLASPYGLLSPAGLGDPSAISSLPLCHDDDSGQLTDINHIHLSPEEFDAVLAAFDTPGLEDAQ